MTTTAIPIAPAVGEVIETLDHYRALPIGATWTTRRGTRWTKSAADAAVSDGGSTRALDSLSLGGNVVQSLPGPISGQVSFEGPVEGIECPLSPETPTQFLHRFRTTMWGNTIWHGVSQESVPEVMRTLGVPPEIHAPGAPVYGSDSPLLSRLPRGTVVEYGTDPTDYENYMLGVVQNNGIHRILGGVREVRDKCFYIKTVPGVTDPAPFSLEEWSSEMGEQMRDLKARAWAEGMRVKRRHSWCETFEVCLGRADVTVADSAERGGTAAVYVTAEEAAALPAGTVLRFASRGQQMTFLRDDAYTNPARTRRLMGTAPGDWMRGGMQVLPAGGLIPVATVQELDTVPEGTVICETSRPDRVQYTKVANNMWRRNGDTYEYRARDFNAPYMSYRNFPTPASA